MESLPDELKLQAFAPPDQKTLSALRATSRQVTGAAEEHLYAEPTIALKDSANFFESRVLAFYCSLLRKLKLATFVTRLTVKPEARLVGYHLRDVFPDVPADHHLMVEHQNKILATTECELVSRILKKTSNLRELDIEILAASQTQGHEYDHLRYDPQPMQSLFGDAPSLGEIRGLSHLTKLRISAGKIDWQWCKLPNLVELYIGRECMMQNDVEPQSSNIRKLELEMSTRVFNSAEPTWHEYDHMLTFFNGFSTLVNLTLILSNYDPPSPSEWSEEILEEEYHEAWNTLLNRLPGVHDILEEIEITVEREGSSYFFPCWLTAMTTWRPFKRLRKIVGPFSLFWDDLGAGAPTAVQHYYPDCIERITATLVPMYIPVYGVFVKPLLQAIGSFPHLRKIDIFPTSESDTQTWEDEADCEEMERVIKQLQALRVEVKVWDENVEDECPWRQD